MSSQRKKSYLPINWIFEQLEGILHPVPFSSESLLESLSKRKILKDGWDMVPYKSSVLNLSLQNKAYVQPQSQCFLECSDLINADGTGASQKCGYVLPFQSKN